MTITALSKTIDQARRNYWAVRAIDDDCLIFQNRDVESDWIQVIFDNFSDSNKFVGATHADGTRFRSYAGVRKAVSS